MQNMRKIVDRLNRWAYEYYVQDAPTVSDREYDELYRTLENMERESGVVLPDSPTRRVGGDPIKGFERHRHIARLYSLDKAVTQDELSAFFARVEKSGLKPSYTVEYKFDGLTMCLTYDGGRFVGASTRGNGIEGEDVTAQALTVRSFPLSISYQGRLEVRGEAVIRLSALEQYNSAHPDEPLKNARNAAAGAIRNLDPKVTAQRRPEILFYDINFMSEQPVASQEQAMAFLKAEGFQVYPFFRVCSTYDEVIAAIEEIEVERHGIDVLTDGAVVKVNEEEVRARLGYTDKFPRWAIAYKFEAEEQETTVRRVFWQVGRTGKLTPLAEVEPVELAGATVRRATLNNYGDLTRKEVKVGSRVLIRRSNEVIPEILGAVSHVQGSVPVEKPSVCPFCGSPVRETGANLFCPNEACAPRVVQRLTHYCSKNAADIEGMSESTLTLLYEKRGVAAFSQLYELNKQSFAGLEGFRDKKISNLLNAIDNSRTLPLDRFLYAIGIEGVGRVAARALAERCQTWEEVAALTEEQLLEMDDIGAITAHAIAEFFASPRNREELERLRALGVTPSPPVRRKPEGAFSGESVVLTGKLVQMSRSEAQALIEQAGGVCQSAVTGKTTLVIAGDAAGSKLDKAKKAGIRIIDEREFMRLLGRE